LCATAQVLFQAANKQGAQNTTNESWIKCGVLIPCLSYVQIGHFGFDPKGYDYIQKRQFTELLDKKIGFNWG